MRDLFKEFVEKYKNSPQEIKEIIDSDKIQIFVDDSLKETGAHSKHKSKLISLITYRLLDVVDQNYLISELELIGLGNEKNSLSSKIENFVKETLGHNIKESVMDIEEEIKETEAVLSTLNPIRTMSGDNDLFKQEKVHSSSQFDLFGLMGKRKEGTEKTSPKWDTDN